MINRILLLLGVIVIAMYYYTYSITYNISLIPSEVLKELSKDGYIIGFTDVLEVNGKISYNNKIIYIKNRKSLLHEIGHYVDYKCDVISLSDNFIEVYRREKNNILDPAYNKSSKEYFAEMYKQYILYENRVKRLSPETYSYIKMCSDKFN